MFRIALDLKIRHFKNIIRVLCDDKLHDLVLVYNSLNRLLSSINYIRIMPDIQLGKVV